MSTSAGQKRSWKLQEFVAHVAQVNCLGLGHRSGRVLVTGGEDKKVNLWAVGKPNCIMSLSGHSSPIQSVRFGHTEELVCAGSESGALKIWDLEAARLVRTLTGHKAGISCIEFHPYGEYLASGSLDTCLKLWDTRRKGCIFSYKGHTQKVNCLRFSPDGQWIASGGEDGAVKVWDLRAGKLMNDLDDQSGGVNDVEFHPHEFLLAAANQNKTISFWDLEKMTLLGSTLRETCPPRSILFHPEGECMFSATQDSLKVHGWEPSRNLDSLPMNWSKITDIATANQQLIGAAFHQSHVSLYVVDLKRVQPFCGLNIPEKEQKAAVGGGGSDDACLANVTFRAGQSVRRSFVKEKPEEGRRGVAPAQMKISEETSDKSGTEGEDSDAVTHAEIPDISNYENVFQPRKRQLAHTPPPPEAPFEDPHPSDQDMPLPVRAVDPMNFHASKLNKKVSPSPTRRASQPAMPTGYHSGSRRGSITAGGGGNIVDVMKPQEVHLRNSPHSGQQQRPTSVYDDHRGGRASASVPREMPSSPVRAAYRTAVNLNAATAAGVTDQEYLPAITSPSPYSSSATTPLPPPHAKQPSSPAKAQASPLPYPSPYHHAAAGSPGLHHTPDRPATVRPHRASESNITYFGSAGARESAGQQPPPVEQAEKVEMVPSMSDRPTGLNASDFLPQKFGGLQIGVQPTDNGQFGMDRLQPQYSESEVTSSILKDHPNVMAVITQRARNLEIVRRLWHSKDAKTAVEQAVEFKDPAVVVDLLSVIILRPSIWNLDLCMTLLPPIGDALLSKYESYVTGASAALKLILKNFGSVIRSNIDTPSTTVGVDISKEERLNKCLDCYRELVKIRSNILKRQTIQGKSGHAFRELAILMQCLD